MQLPAPVLLVTMAVDVQVRYLAVLVVGWAPDAECWVLDWSTIEGDPRDPATLLGFVQGLDAIRFEHEPGTSVPLHLVGIDSGFATTHVYRAVQSAPRRATKWVYATKGFGGRAGEPLVLPVRDERDLHGRRGLRPLPINADGCKEELFSMLQIEAPGRGYVHLPKRVGPDFVKQLTSEEARTKYDDGGIATGTAWVKTSERNEALDTMCINLALFHHMRPAQWLALLVQRYGRDDGTERWRALHPGARIHTPRETAPRPSPWLARRERA